MKSRKFRDFKFEDFESKEILGQGSYGVVKRAIHKDTGEVFALKEIKMKDSTEGIPGTSLREISLLKKIDHPNIIKLHGVINDNYEQLTLVFEYIKGDLRDLVTNLDKDVVIPEQQIKEIMYQILLACSY